MQNKLIGFFICTLFISTIVFPVFGFIDRESANIRFDDILLPPPLNIDMILEESICRRMSVRSFTGESVTDEELSTVLWAAYGYTENDNRSIFSPDGIYSTVIYVIRSDATYKYVPEDNSLSLFKTGNYLYLGQYDEAPIKFGLVWDKNVESDEMKGMAQIGMIGQNIYFDANALDLGTVTTGMYVDELYQLGLPSNEKPEIIMPFGHPDPFYDFTYKPLHESNLPSIINNTLSLEDAINNRLIVNIWDNTPLLTVEQSQLIWSSYGASYLWDNVNNDRHRTLPSAINKYPFKVFAADENGVYQYNPSTHSITTIIQEDRREAINNSLESSNIAISTASWIIIPCLDTNLGSTQYQTFWYYEVGAISYNVLLESAALNLSANIVDDIINEADLRTALGITSQTNLLPWAIIPVGHPLFETPNNPPITPTITGRTSGKPGEEYTFCIPAITDPDGDNLYVYWEWGDGINSGWLGPFESGQEICANHSWDTKDNYIIRAKLKDDYGAESGWGTFEITIPRTRIFYYYNWLSFLEHFPILQKLINRLEQ